MGYADGYYYGQGRIRVDTSTFSVGDEIRVRSMTDSTKIYDKTVATVGTPLIFTVPPYDTYKVCQIQTISDVVTEIGGEFFNIGFGDFANATALNKATLGGHQGILNAHQETSQLSIGDEVPITVNGADWIMQIAGINVYHAHDIMYTSKHIWTTTTSTNTYTGNNNLLRQKAQEFYANIDNKDKQYIKQVTRQAHSSSGDATYDDYCFILGNRETANASGYGTVGSQTQMPLFVTQSNRIKTYNGTAFTWFTADWGQNQQRIDASGSMGYGIENNGVVPAFMLIADS